jgi:hypothetical protein
LTPHQPSATTYVAGSFSDNYYKEISSKLAFEVEKANIKVLSVLKTIGEEVSSSKNVLKADKRLKNVLKEKKLITGAFFAYIPSAAIQGKRHFMIWYVRTKKQIKRLAPNFTKFNYFKMKWYLKPLRTNKIYYTPPYFDKTLKKIMISALIPVYKKNLPIGVAGCDIPLSHLNSVINTSRFGENGFAFLLNAEGLIIGHPNPAYIGKVNIFRIPRPVSIFNTGGYDEVMIKLGNLMIKKRLKGMSVLKNYLNGRVYKAFYSPVSDVYFSVCIMIENK